MCGGLFCLVVGVWLLVLARTAPSSSDALAGLELMVTFVGILFVAVGVVSIVMFVALLRWVG